MKKFIDWMENEESPALAEPQHKRGESNLGLDDIVERRVRQMIMDLESSAKGTQQEILNSLRRYVEKRTAPQSAVGAKPPEGDQQAQNSLESLGQES